MSTATCPALPAGPAPAPQTPPPTVDSSSLLQGRREITITHNGVVYRLQATRQGKLILTK